MDREAVSIAVEDLTDEGSSGFRASAVARRIGSRIEDVTPTLMRMVGEGRLRLQFDLVCPDNGRTIESFSDEDELPIGQERSSDRCASDEPFVVERRHIWITFVPTEDFRITVRRRRANPPNTTSKRAEDDPPGLPGRRRTTWRRTWRGAT